MDVAEELVSLVSQITRRKREAIGMTATLTDHGLDSLSLLVFREQCEHHFGVTIPDETWGQLSTLDGITAIVEQAIGRTSHFSSSVTQLDTVPDITNGLQETFHIGMPLTGINNLAETPLLKLLGDLRWRHIARLTGIPTSMLTDVAGNRLYPAFFYVDLHFGTETPMAAYRENDSLTVIDTVERFGSSMIDGIALLGRPNQAPDLGWTSGPSSGRRPAGQAFARMSNIFVMKFDGAEWLKKGRPRDGLLDSLRVSTQPPDCYVLAKEAQKREFIEEPGAHHVALLAQTAVFQYTIQPERDVNGVGLLYFANYPTFLDLAERNALRSARWPWPDEYTNRLTVVRRRIVYMNNASWNDRLRIESDIWIEVSSSEPTLDPALAPVILLNNQKIYRESDGRLMCVCSSRKMLYGMTCDEVEWLPGLIEV